MRVSTSSDASRRVAVTGLGLVSPLGLDLPSAWTALRDGTSRPTTHEHRLGDEAWGTFPLFRVDGFDARRLPLPDGACAYAETHGLFDDADLMFLVGALTAALADAGLEDARGARDVGPRIGAASAAGRDAVGRLFFSASGGGHESWRHSSRLAGAR